MIAIIVPLGSGTFLPNVQYAWTVAGVQGSFLNTGITQPDPNFPLFRIVADVPTNAEELTVSDVTDPGNYNVPDFELDLL